MELVSSQTMQKAEKALSEKYGVDTLLLMENAGRGVTEGNSKSSAMPLFLQSLYNVRNGQQWRGWVSDSSPSSLRFPTFLF